MMSLSDYNIVRTLSYFNSDVEQPLSLAARHDSSEKLSKCFSLLTVGRRHFRTNSQDTMYYTHTQFHPSSSTTTVFPPKTGSSLRTHYTTQKHTHLL